MYFEKQNNNNNNKKKNNNRKKNCQSFSYFVLFTFPTKQYNTLYKRITFLFDRTLELNIQF